MSDIDWPLVRDLFDAVVELPEAERAAHLGRAGVGPEVRGEVERMLRSDGAASGFLESSSPLLEKALLPQMGTRLGHYELKRVIASGGMGTVFEAVQDEPHRTVALKTLRLGLFSSPERLQRFRFEAEVLGSLRHPSIAQVFEAGTHEEAGEHVPFIAMELVPGARDILSYAREEDLELPARLELFLEVCEAVQHGHQKGVIHRDLKPSNILVDAEGRAKVIDFGVARATASASPFGAVATQTGQILGTLAYMAPEQLAGSPDAVDVRSDVYALGILLFELVEGRPPHELADKSPVMALRTIQEEPPRPSASTPRELGWILEKALAKEPERRYGSVSELAADLRRYVRGEPVLAGPPSVAYRLAKWIQRNPARSSAAAIAAVAFVTIAWLLLQNVRVNRFLSTANIALKTKTAEAEASAVQALENARVAMANERRATDEKERADREAEAATRKADEVLRLSAQQELDDLVAEADRLWPAVPENLSKYDEWQRRADKLAAQLPDHEKKLAELRSRAVPWTEEEQARRRAGHPKLAELAMLKRAREWLGKLGAALASQPGRDPTPQELGADLSSLPATVDEFWALAWPLVDPDRQDYGGEEKGLVLARRALELAGELPREQRAEIRKTLSWALYANGRYDEALAEGERALEEAATDRKDRFKVALDYMKKLIAAGEEKRARGMASIEQRIAALEAEIAMRTEWFFADAQDQWWHNQLQRLVEGLKVFSDTETGLMGTGTVPEHGWGIPKRAEFALTIADRSVSGAEAAARWSEAASSIANVEECPSYHGLRIFPQLGLLPIGRDPDSGLWEFAHLQTGDPARRGADGKLTLTEETGLVLVLLPGGSFMMGAQKSDPARPNYDPWAIPQEGPPHEVPLSPFFLSKYEMTQLQWWRLVGRNPGAPRWADGRGLPADPVARVSWDDCTKVLMCLGLELPSEAQWEYGARAGTTTVWWTGNEIQTLAEAGMVFEGSNVSEEKSYVQVGSYRANAFGLHDVIGNLAEWCRDGYQEDFYYRQVIGNLTEWCRDGNEEDFYYRRGSQKDPVSAPESVFGRVHRGGSYCLPPLVARSASRGYKPPWAFDDDVGVRPARALQAP